MTILRHICKSRGVVQGCTSLIFTASTGVAYDWQLHCPDRNLPQSIELQQCDLLMILRRLSSKVAPSCRHRMVDTSAITYMVSLTQVGQCLPVCQASGQPFLAWHKVVPNCNERANRDSNLASNAMSSELRGRRSSTDLYVELQGLQGVYIVQAEPL